ncbi:hypothetical protein LguiB_030907 [Lonicera macranthoides]
MLLHISNKKFPKSQSKNFFSKNFFWSKIMDRLWLLEQNKAIDRLWLLEQNNGPTK